MLTLFFAAPAMGRSNSRLGPRTLSTAFFRTDCWALMLSWDREKRGSADPTFPFSPQLSNTPRAWTHQSSLAMSCGRALPYSVRSKLKAIPRVVLKEFMVLLGQFFRVIHIGYAWSVRLFLFPGCGSCARADGMVSCLRGWVGFLLGEWESCMYASEGEVETQIGRHVDRMSCRIGLSRVWDVTFSPFVAAVLEGHACFEQFFSP